MPTHVAFLRGMNLGKRRIKNEELRAEFEALLGPYTRRTMGTIEQIAAKHCDA